MPRRGKERAVEPTRSPSPHERADDVEPTSVYPAPPPEPGADPVSYAERTSNLVREHIRRRHFSTEAPSEWDTPARPVDGTQELSAAENTTPVNDATLPQSHGQFYVFSPFRTRVSPATQALATQSRA